MAVSILFQMCYMSSGSKICHIRRILDVTLYSLDLPVSTLGETLVEMYNKKKKKKMKHQKQRFTMRNEENDGRDDGKTDR